MGLLLKEKGLLPDLMVTSPAKRALRTAKMIADAIDYPKNRIEVREDIYEQGMNALIELIGELDDGLESVFLIGHNPDLTDLANRLTGAGIHNMPTCSIVSVEFPLSNWRDCTFKGGRLGLFKRPAKPNIGTRHGEEWQDADIIGT